MELIDAKKIVDLMKQRDLLLDMRVECDQHPNTEWNLMVCDKKIRIPYEAKGHFINAIYNALDAVEQEIEKL